ncbi:hypothetical protein AB833_02865 [Chromatiales bacterium (ex Bugula neritina AB1)]|nr:hypothetical protein AB833_02865 [Chromatiales bacterium (ex Bugula neritina AB1)]
MNSVTTQNDEPEEPSEYLEPSKSQRKREARSVQALAETLVNLQPARLDQLPLTDQIHYAVSHCPPPATRGARKRQLQFIGKLLRKTESIEELRHLLEHPQHASAAAHHEAMRNNLLESFTDHADELLRHYPEINLQQARQLVRSATKEVKLQQENQQNSPVKNSTESASASTIRNTKPSKALLKMLLNHDSKQ